MMMKNKETKPMITIGLNFDSDFALISQNGTNIQAIPAIPKKRIPTSSPSTKRMCPGRNFNY
jgi:hypothetical protein